MNTKTAHISGADDFAVLQPRRAQNAVDRRRRQSGAPREKSWMNTATHTMKVGDTDSCGVANRLQGSWKVVWRCWR